MNYPPPPSVGDRTKVSSLIGTSVVLWTIDGQPMRELLAVTIEEISPAGLLFRDQGKGLIFGSTASFRLATDEEISQGYGDSAERVGPPTAEPRVYALPGEWLDDEETNAVADTSPIAGPRDR